MESLESLWTWISIILCLSQSAMFSGLNLALFSLGRMKLEAESEKGNTQAAQILQLRHDSNRLLCTILWGNVSVNVLLALLSESVLAGIGGFVFSTAGITFFGEIIPQAYFSRNALRVGAKLIPIIKFYQIVFYPLAKPCALILDGWIGPEGPSFFRERDIEIILKKHINQNDSEISPTEGIGALNFLALDDRKVSVEGRVVRDETILTFPSRMQTPIFPELASEEGQTFLDSLKIKPAMYRIILDEESKPIAILDTIEFLARYSINGIETDVYRFCHRPIVTTETQDTLDTVLENFVVEADDHKDNIVDQDVVLYWTEDSKRILTGADILGYLLHGIARREPMSPADRAES